MTYILVETSAAQRDQRKATRKNPALAVALRERHFPEIQRSPREAGHPPRGALAHCLAREVVYRGVSFRLIYTISGTRVTVIAFGPHDDAYAAAARRES